MKYFARLWRFITHDTYAQLLSAVMAVMAVMAIGTAGSIIGQRWSIVPASSFGTTGEWVAGAAAVAAIVALALDARERARTRDTENKRRDDEAERRDQQARRSEIVQRASKAIELVEQVNLPTKVHANDHPYRVQLASALRDLAGRTAISELTRLAELLTKGWTSTSIRWVDRDDPTSAWEELRASIIEILMALCQLDDADDLDLLGEIEPGARQKLGCVVDAAIATRLLTLIRQLAEAVIAGRNDNDQLRETMNEYITRYRDGAQLYSLIESVLAGSIGPGEARQSLTKVVERLMTRPRC